MRLAVICALTGRHKWDREVDPSPGIIFQRIDCVRCGLAIDGAKVRAIKAALPANHWMLRRLP